MKKTSTLSSSHPIPSYGTLNHFSDDDGIKITIYVQIHSASGVEWSGVQYLNIEMI